MPLGSRLRRALRFCCVCRQPSLMLVRQHDHRRWRRRGNCYARHRLDLADAHPVRAEFGRRPVGRQPARGRDRWCDRSGRRAGKRHSDAQRWRRRVDPPRRSAKASPPPSDLHSERIAVDHLERFACRQDDRPGGEPRRRRGSRTDVRVLGPRRTAGGGDPDRGRQRAPAGASGGCPLGYSISGVQSVELNPQSGVVSTTTQTESASGSSSAPGAPTPTNTHPSTEQVQASVVVVFTIAPG